MKRGVLDDEEEWEEVSGHSGLPTVIAATAFAAMAFTSSVRAKTKGSECSLAAPKLCR